MGKNSMSVIAFYQSKGILNPQLSNLGCFVNYYFIGNNLKIKKYFTQSNIYVCGSLMVTVDRSNSMFTTSHRSDQNEITGDTGNLSTCGPQGSP